MWHCVFPSVLSTLPFYWLIHTWKDIIFGTFTAHFTRMKATRRLLLSLCVWVSLLPSFPLSYFFFYTSSKFVLPLHTFISSFWTCFLYKKWKKKSFFFFFQIIWMYRLRCKYLFLIWVKMYLPNNKNTPEQKKSNNKLTNTL